MLITNEEVFELKTLFEMLIQVDRYSLNLNYMKLYKRLCNEINYKNEYMEELYEELLEWKKQADECYKKKSTIRFYSALKSCAFQHVSFHVLFNSLK